MSSNVFKNQILTRPNHFEGQVVKDKHLLTEQDYLSFLRMVNNYYLHQVSGVLTGLGVSLKGGTTLTLQVSPGLGHYAVTIADASVFQVMQEVCLLKTQELDLTGKISSSGDYKLVATTSVQGDEVDANLHQPHYMLQNVTLAVAPVADAVTGLSLATFTYDSNAKTITAPVGAKVLTKTVRSINGKDSDEFGDVKISGDELIKIINQATTVQINETHVAGVTRTEFTNLVKIVNDLQVQVNTLNKRVPRFKEVRG